MHIGILGYNSNTGLGNCIMWYKKHLPINSFFVIKHPTAHKSINGLINTMEAIDFSEIYFREYLEKYKPNMIIIFETPFNFNYLKIAKEHKCKIIIIPMMDAIKAIDFLVYQDCIDCFLCPNNYCYNVYENLYKQKTIEIPYPIDTDFFNLTNNNSDFLFIHNQGNGGAHFRKGTDLIYHSFKDLFKQYKDISLLIQHQSQLPNIYKLPENIENANYKYIEKDYASQLSLYDQGVVYIAPSRREGLGLPIMEAMSCGMPIITTNGLPMNSYWKNKDYPLLIDAYQVGIVKDAPEYSISINNLTKTMEWCYLHQDKLKKIGKNNRKIIVENYSWKVNKEKILNLFEDILR